MSRDARAMELFEKAIEKELHGLMSDAVRFYREAFKLNDHIDLLYRQQKVPSAMAKLTAEHGKNASRKVDPKKLRMIDAEQLLALFRDVEAKAPDPTDPDQLEEGQVAIKFAALGLSGHDEVADARPVSVLTRLPSEIWVYILDILIAEDPELWFRFGITCKRHAYLAFASSALWRRLCYLVYPLQQYEENVGVMGELPVPRDPLRVLPQYAQSWKQMFRTRPFVKFLGCYISVVNYYSEGGRLELSQSWTNPVRTITYYRYLRFYPDGACVMALTRLEPTVVVPQLLRHNDLKCLLANPELRDSTKINPATEPHKLIYGRWTISTEGEVHVSVDAGSVPYYFFHYNFKVKTLGSASNHCTLAWVNSYAIWKSVPGHREREGEVVDFSLRNEKDFKFLRVRSYKLDN